MQRADAVLDVIRYRGTLGLPLERVYRQLFNRDLYLLAYGRIYRNKGAMTPGATEETADGMSLAKIDAIIDALRHERYRWTPARRIYIEKKRSTKKRPLGLPTWSDKLVQEVVRLILDAYYEPQFSDHSHGFRPGRGCHTALREIYRHWNGTVWFIEGDISACFDSLDHDVLLATLSETIHDGRFIALIGELLKAGYLEEWTYHATYSGTPQGGVVSPILANIYLDRLDRWMETTLLPHHNRGDKRQENPAYKHAQRRESYWRLKGNHEAARPWRTVMKRLPSKLPSDPSFRRLRYVRYADDWLLSFIGPKEEAEEIKREVGDYLRDTLHLELSAAKTLITHARTERARFLGYEVHVLADDTVRSRSKRRINGVIGLRVPSDVIRSRCASHLTDGKPRCRTEWTNDGVYDIMTRYQQAYRGIVEYYRMAYNLRDFCQLAWVMEGSLLRTLARKLDTTSAKVQRRYEATFDTPDGPLTGLQVIVEREGKRPLVAKWGGISLKRRVDVVLNDQPPRTWVQRTELEQRLLADACELCGSQEDVEVHHIRALRDLKREGRAPKPLWVQTMAARRRKTLVLCHACHMDVEYGHPHKQVETDGQMPESRIY